MNKIDKYLDSVRNGLDIVEYTHKVIDESKKINDEYHPFNNISEELALSQAKALSKKNLNNLKIPGLFVSVKD